jgi:hypothetical protein
VTQGDREGLHDLGVAHLSEQDDAVPDGVPPIVLEQGQHGFAARLPQRADGVDEGAAHGPVLGVGERVGQGRSHDGSLAARHLVQPLAFVRVAL